MCNGVCIYDKTIIIIDFNTKIKLEIYTIAITNLLSLALLLVLHLHNNTECQNKKKSCDIAL